MCDGRDEMRRAGKSGRAREGNSRAGAGRLVACAACACLAWGAAGSAAAQSHPATRPVVDREATFRAARHAEAFLRSLAPKIDPVRLRTEHRMKGKKFYVEYLSAWREICLLHGEGERRVIRSFLVPIVARTDTDAYHNLAGSSDEEFKQDVISYLNACVLHGEFGFDTTRYRREIDRIVPRILSPAHLSQRGIDNTMAIVYRLRQLGYEGGPSYCELFARPGCVVRMHPNLTQLDLDNPLAKQPVYDMTHEIFYLTEFGRTPLQCASERDLRYVRRMHAALIPIFIEKKDLDALAELIMDLNYLEMTDLPEYATGRAFLLTHQNEDGSWGDREHIGRIAEVILRVNPKYQVDVGQYLHTTGVTLSALCYPLQSPATRPATRPSAGR